MTQFCLNLLHILRAVLFSALDIVHRGMILTIGPRVLTDELGLSRDTCFTTSALKSITKQFFIWPQESTRSILVCQKCIEMNQQIIVNENR